MIMEDVMDQVDMARPDGPGSREPSPIGLGPSGFDPSRWPSNDDVLAELRQRDPEGYEGVLSISYTPGDGDGATLEEITEAIRAVDREMADPVYHLAAQLDGEAFLYQDASAPPVSIYTLEPADETQAEKRERMRKARIASLMKRAAAMLRSYRDSDGSPQGEDAPAAEFTTARAEGIAQGDAA